MDFRSLHSTDSTIMATRKVQTVFNFVEVHEVRLDGNTILSAGDYPIMGENVNRYTRTGRVVHIRMRLAFRLMIVRHKY